MALIIISATRVHGTFTILPDNDPRNLDYERIFYKENIAKMSADYVGYKIASALVTIDQHEDIDPKFYGQSIVYVLIGIVGLQGTGAPIPPSYNPGDILPLACPPFNSIPEEFQLKKVSQQDV